MIARQHRFHGHNSLRQVYQNGRTARAANLAIRVFLNPRRKTFRIAVVVSTKVDKSAVVRNRIRRRLYEQACSYRDQITKPYDLVFTAFSNQLAVMPADKLAKTVHELLLKANILDSGSKSQRAIVEAKES